MLPGWNINYAMPQGWQVSQNLGRIQMLASNTQAGAIFVAPGLYSDFNVVTADVTLFYQAMGHMAYPVEQPAPTNVAGMQAMAARIDESSGQDAGSRGEFIFGRSPMAAEGEAIAVLEWAFHADPAQSLLLRLEAVGLGLALPALGLIAVLAYLAGSLLTGRLRALALAADRIGEEGPGTRVPVKGHDEIARVAQADRFREGILVVIVEQDAWRQELEMQRDEILRKIQNCRGGKAVEKIVFKAAGIREK